MKERCGNQRLASRVGVDLIQIFLKVRLHLFDRGGYVMPADTPSVVLLELPRTLAQLPSALVIGKLGDLIVHLLDGFE